MSISTYAELQTAITNWLHRDGLSTYIPDFITIGESRIAREIRARVMEQRTTASLSTSSSYINVPSDFIEWRSLWLSADPRQRLEYLAPDAFFEKYTSTSTGRPVCYTVIGDEIRFGPSPDSAYTVELWYYKKLAALSSSTNSLFTGNPDLYLYAALCATAPFLKDDKRIPVWEVQYKMVKDSVNATERDGRYPSGLRMVAG